MREGVEFRAYCIAFVNVFVEITNRYLFLGGVLTDRDLVAMQALAEEEEMPKEAFLKAFEALFEDSMEKGYSRLKEEQQIFWSNLLE